MGTEKYIAYYAADNEFETFESFDEAKEWLLEFDESDGYPEETVNGENFIAKITHRSKINITEKKEDYHQHTDSCPSGCVEEEWPYNDEWEYIGDVEYIPVVE